MASSKEYLIFILEQLSGLDDITYRAMMGEYILYYRERVIGGIYDDRFLVKPVRAAVNLMPNAEMEVPYEGAKGMLLVDDVDDREYLVKLFEAMYDELPERKKKQNVIFEPAGVGMRVLMLAGFFLTKSTQMSIMKPTSVSKMEMQI